VNKPTQEPSSSALEQRPSGSSFEQQKVSFDREAQSRNLGAQRAQSFQGNRPSFGGGGRRR